MLRFRGCLQGGSQMIDDIVARLRDLDIYDDVTIGATIDEAADEIERLRAIIEALEGEIRETAEASND